MLRRLSIGPRLVLLLLAGAGAVLWAVVGYSARASRRILEEELQVKARAIAVATAGRITDASQSVERTVDTLALSLETLSPADDRLAPLLREAVRRNSDLFGSAVARVPDKPAAAPHYVPYVYRAKEGLAVRDLATPSYDVGHRDWYRQPLDRRRPVWSEPYLDEGGGEILMATYSVPVLSRDGSVRAIVTGDVSLGFLTELLSSLPVGEAGYAFLISPSGKFLAHPTRSLVMRESIFGVADARRDPVLRAVGERMTRGESGFVPILSLSSRKPSFVAFSPALPLGSVGVIFRREAITGRVNRLTAAQVLIGAAGFLILVGVVFTATRSIVRPIRDLERATTALARGDLDTPIPVLSGRDEVARLASAFATMQTDLRTHIEELKVATKGRERLEGELRIARSIQRALIPKEIVQRPEFDLAVLLEPAREVGGDFYDFFELDGDRFVLAVGDVSGKGIPAALYMSAAGTLLRALVREQGDPGLALTRLNAELSANSASSMFVTLFVAVVHLPTGECLTGNGGHNPPFVAHPDGSVDLLPVLPGFVIGPKRGLTYRSGSYTLAPGETLLLYTDGVTEAMDRAENMFGSERTAACLSRSASLGCGPVVQTIRKAVADFSDGAPQSDDITILAFRYPGDLLPPLPGTAPVRSLEGGTAR